MPFLCLPVLLFFIFTNKTYIYIIIYTNQKFYAIALHTNHLQNTVKQHTAPTFLASRIYSCLVEFHIRFFFVYRSNFVMSSIIMHEIQWNQANEAKRYWTNDELNMNISSNNYDKYEKWKNCWVFQTYAKINWFEEKWFYSLDGLNDILTPFHRNALRKTIVSYIIIG